MKKIMFTLMLLLSVVSGALAQNDAMYVYRNDGEFNAFLKSDIDSMRYSHIDIDSVFHNDWQVQEVFTEDSVYRIPIAAIDSISFVTPPIEYQKNVQQADAELLKYVVSHTDHSLTFLSSTPSYLIPTIGDVFVCERYEEPLPNGFAGRLVSIERCSDSIVCKFEDVGIGDIYSHIVLVGKGTTIYEDGKSKPRRIFKNGNGSIELPVSIPLEANLNEILKKESRVEGNISVTLKNPEFTVDYLICWGEKNLANTIMAVVKLESEGNVKVNAKLGGTYEPEPHVVLPIPVHVGPVCGEIDLGLYFEASGDISFDYSQDFRFRRTLGFHWNENLGFIDISNKQNHDYFDKDEPNAELSINGSMGFGFSADVLLGIINRNTASLDALVKFGLEVSGKLQLASSETGFNTDLYKTLKNSEISTCLRLKVEPRYRVFWGGAQKFGVSASLVFAEDNCRIIPSFSDLLWKSNGSKSGELYANVSNDVFVPVQLGWSLVDEDGKVSYVEYFPDSYLKFEQWDMPTMQMTLKDLPTSFNYKAYPIIKLWNWEIPCDEYVEVKSSGCPAKITDFKQTDSHYSNGAYANDGRTYDYKYEVSTTVEIESLDGVADWGYVYKDPYGNIKRISLMRYGTSYTDTHYAYYRNEAKSTACLYGYVKYVGDDEYYDGEPHDYPLEYLVHTCPDNNHPHAIDLGLPSGTKWACCNVGASSPEQNGGYYAWGETSEKSVYNWDTYQYGSSWDNCVNIGSDIAGTSYDVAHVKMGGSWRMPSHEQQMELMKKCTRKWTQQNGVNGVLVTGMNGGQLFLPAAGDRWDSDLNHAGSYGLYWSSSLSPGYDNSAFGLFFDSDYCYFYNDPRSYGQSVRAVCP